MDKQILYYYQRGVASYLIAKKLGVSNTKVRGTLRRYGIKIRSHDITNKVSADRRTPEENRAITQRATEANTGSTHSSIHRSRLAISRQKNPTIDAVYEQPLLELCREVGLLAIPQKAFYKYNVDLYLSEYNVVIEIFGGGFHNKPQAIKLFQNKMRYLSNKKIPVLVVWADRLTYDPQAVLKVAMQTKEKLTIIDGTGQPTTRGLGDIILDD